MAPRTAHGAPGESFHGSLFFGEILSCALTQRLTKHILKREKPKTLPHFPQFGGCRDGDERCSTCNKNSFILSAVADKRLLCCHIQTSCTPSNTGWRRFWRWFLLRRCLNQLIELKCSETCQALFCQCRWTNVSVTAVNAHLCYHPDPVRLSTNTHLNPSWNV